MTLYHYCTTSTLLNIVENKSVWLSSLSSSNDTQEGRWLSTILGDVARKHGISERQSLELHSMFRFQEDQMDALGLCLSSRGDMLSQWRGYANDAAGVAIGFNEDFLHQLRERTPGIFLERVIYERAAQVDLLNSRFGEILDLVRKGALEWTERTESDGSQSSSQQSADRISASVRLVFALLEFTDILYLTKNPAFREERGVLPISADRSARLI